MKLGLSVSSEVFKTVGIFSMWVILINIVINQNCGYSKGVSRKLTLRLANLTELNMCPVKTPISLAFAVFSMCTPTEPLAKALTQTEWMPRLIFFVTERTSCADPESFVKRGQTLTTFCCCCCFLLFFVLSWRGIYGLNATISGPSSAQQLMLAW